MTGILLYIYFILHAAAYKFPSWIYICVLVIDSIAACEGGRATLLATPLPAPPTLNNYKNTTLAYFCRLLIISVTERACASFIWSK